MAEERKYPRLGDSFYDGIFEDPPEPNLLSENEEREVIERLVAGFNGKHDQVLNALQSGERDKVKNCNLMFATAPGNAKATSFPLFRFIPKSAPDDGDIRRHFEKLYIRTNLFWWLAVFFVVMVVASYLPSRISQMGAMPLLLDCISEPFPHVGVVLCGGLSFVFALCALFFYRDNKREIKHKLHNTLSDWETSAKGLKQNQNNVLDKHIVNLIYESKRLLKLRRFIKRSNRLHYRIIRGIAFVLPLFFGVVPFVLLGEVFFDLLLGAVVAALATFVVTRHLQRFSNFLWWYYTTNTDPSGALSVNFLATLDNLSRNAARGGI